MCLKTRLSTFIYPTFPSHRLAYTTYTQCRIRLFCLLDFFRVMENKDPLAKKFASIHEVGQKPLKQSMLDSQVSSPTMSENSYMSQVLLNTRILEIQRRILGNNSKLTGQGTYTCRQRIVTVTYMYYTHQMLVVLFQYCFVLDSGYSGVFLWTGKKCSNEFKKKVWNATNVRIMNL